MTDIDSRYRAQNRARQARHKEKRGPEKIRERRETWATVEISRDVVASLKAVLTAQGRLEGSANRGISKAVTEIISDYVSRNMQEAGAESLPAPPKLSAPPPEKPPPTASKPRSPKVAPRRERRPPQETLRKKNFARAEADAANRVPVRITFVREHYQLPWGLRSVLWDRGFQHRLHIWKGRLKPEDVERMTVDVGKWTGTLEVTGGLGEDPSFKPKP
jgi:hypothetical protein